MQIFCLVFWPFLSIFKNLAESWPNLHVVPHSGIQTLKMSKKHWSKVFFNEYEVVEYVNRLA